MYTKRLAFIALLPLILAGCVNTQTEPVINGGVYRSRDRAQTYEHISNVLSLEGAKSFANDDTNFIMFDPNDNNTLYFSSKTSGLYASYNSGTSWRGILQNKGRIDQLVVEEGAPCHMYAVTLQNVFETEDCGRRWEAKYLEKVSGRTVRSLIMDNDESSKLYLALSDGTILLSTDAGTTWQVYVRMRTQIRRLFANPKNTDQMYVLAPGTLVRSVNAGIDRENLREVIVDEFGFNGGENVYWIYFIPEVENGFYAVTDYGILKTLDGGTNWESLPLLPRPGKQRVLSLAANPANMNELYYSTANGIFYSNDGGVNWQTLNSPSGKIPRHLVVHPVDSAVLYVGMVAPAQ